MSQRAAITINRSPDEIRRLWSEHKPHFIEEAGANVEFKAAPGDRGTEIYVEVAAGGPLEKLFGSGRLAKVKDALRHFKALVETGEVPRSDGTPEGESVERKLKQRPAQPLSENELEKAGV
jgi:uncharacterized membrane protein